MASPVKLRDICHARSGDKGDIANIGLVAYDPAHYTWLAEHVTAAAVTAHLGARVKGPVRRYELANIGALNFVVEGALGGGVTRSLVLDGHGKGFSSILLDMEISAPPPELSSEADAARPARRSTPGPNGKVVRLGGGSAYEGDHLDAARELAASGAIDYLVFDCLSEKTIIECMLRKLDGGMAYDVLLEAKLRAVLAECRRNGVKIIANAGGLDIEGAAEKAAVVARELGLAGTKIAFVTGGEMLDAVRAADPTINETGQPVSSLGNGLLGAHAYGGAWPIAEALAGGADIVLTSRAGDSAQYLGPLLHAFGWASDDWQSIGRGLGLGHLMECAGQVSGGFYADPGMKDVSDLDRLGFPIATVAADGNAVITKLAGTGGTVTAGTVKEQLVYEIADPTDYRHTDGIVDFTRAEVAALGPDLVAVTGVDGKARPDKVKVVLANQEGYVGVGRVLYGGSGAYAKARLAADVVAKRLEALHGVDPAGLRFDYIGVNALFDWHVDTDAAKEVELRVAGSFATRAEAEKVLIEVSMLPCNGPAGAAWGRPLDQGGVEAVVGFYSTLMPHDTVHYEVRQLVA